MTKRSKHCSKHEFLPCLLAVYVVAVTAGMLLVYHDFYYDILETKCIYYCICTVLAILGTGGWLFLAGRPKETVNDKRNLMDLAVVVWGVAIMISTIVSPVRFYAFVGNGGRYAGCFLLMLYVGAYFCITRYYQAKEWHLVIFVAAGLFMCVFGISDFFDMDLLGFKAEIMETQRYKFTSTIGNINTYTSCVAMVMAYAGGMFVAAREKKKAAGYGLCTVVAFFALILGESDNGYLSLAAFFGLLPLYAFRSGRGIWRYVLLAAAFFTAVALVGVILRVMEGQVVPITGLFQVIAGSRFLPGVVAFLWLATGGCYLMERAGVFERPSVTSVLIKAWLILLAAMTLAVLFMLYDVNVAGHGQRYKGLQNYLLFNDEWGTHRGYVWRIAVEDYKKFPLIQKLFGYGPDTFGFVTRMNNYPEMVERYQELFDSAHNEYLQYLVTIGPVGLLAYCGVHIAAAIQVVKKQKGNPMAVAALLAVACYDLQAAVNINQPIATPVMWTLLAVSAAGVARDAS